MKEKFSTYQNKMGTSLKSLSDDKGRVATDAAAALKHTLEFQNVLVDTVSSKFDGIESDVKGLKSSMSNVESRLSPLESTVKKLTEEALPEARTQVRALSTEVRDVSGSVRDALTNANAAKEIAESVKKELETHTSSEETAKKLTIITKALDDVGQELKSLAQKVASIPNTIGMDLGAVEEMIKVELKKLGFFPAGPVAEQKTEDAAKDSTKGAAKDASSVKLESKISKLESATVKVFGMKGLEVTFDSKEPNERIADLEGAFLSLLNDHLGLDVDYQPESTLDARLEDVKGLLKTALDTINSNNKKGDE